MRTHRGVLIATVRAARGSAAAYRCVPQPGKGVGVVSAAHLS